MQGNRLRFADYFFRAGIDPKSNLLKSKLIAVTEDNEEEQLKGGEDAESKKTSRLRNEHPLSYRYEADTIYRYPKEDYSEDEKYPPYTPMFCFPKDLSFISHENGKPPDSYHSFIITESTGAKTYGVCLKTYVAPGKEHAAQIEAMILEWRSQNLGASDYEFAQHVQTQLAFQKEQLLKMKMGVIEQTPQSTHAAEETITVLEELINPLRQSVLVEPETVYVPTCLGVLSHWPWYDFLKDWLCLVASSIQHADFDRCAINLIHEIPLPPPGKLEITVPFGSHKLYISRPPINTPQILKNYSCYPLFRTMSIENIVTLFELLLTEYKVILVSEHASMLTLTCESLCSWLYPFYWHHILIPVLPARLISYLQAPVPFLVGIQKESFPEWKEEGWKPSDAAVVDIDNDIIDFPPLKVKIPSRERRKLLQYLEKYTGQFHHPIRKGVPETMKYAFPYGKLPLQTGDPVIGHRRIKDIPQSMYSMYSNVFLQEKMNAGLSRNLSPIRPSTATSSTAGTTAASAANGNSYLSHPRESQADVHASFDNVAPSVTSTSSNSKGGFNSEAPSTKQLDSTDELVNADPMVIRESIGSFQTPRSSVPDNSLGSSVSPSEIGSTNIAGREESVLESKTSTAIDAPPMAPAPSISSPTKKPNLPWWQKLTTSSTSVNTPNPAGISNRTSRPPSLFDKFLGVHTDSPPQVSINGNFANSPEKLSLDIPSSDAASSTTSQSPNRTHSSEGHVFHELVPLESAEANLGLRDENEEEYADRFTQDSGSSDEMSRSDMSVTADIRPQLFGVSGSVKRSVRSAGQPRPASIVSQNTKRELKGKHETSPTMSKGQRVKATGSCNECQVCREDVDAKTHTVLMCQYCHSQLHLNCISLAPPCEVYFNEEKIANGFFKIFTSVFRYYRSYVKIPDGHESQESQEMSNMAQWFRKSDFLAEFDGDSKPFMTVLLETQAFSQFLLDRVERPENDYEILYFDESIKQKMNRSRMRFSKEATPFLNETTYQISQSIDTLQFDNTNLPLDDFQTADPYEWRKEYEVPPRKVQQLVTEEDQKMMRSHTTELVNRARLHARTKYDLSKWIRLRWKSGAVKDDEVTGSFVSDDQRRELLEENLNQVSAVIDKYESLHISSQTYTQLEKAISVLLEQNQKLLHASDEEQLVDNYMFQHTLVRLMRVISIYQEQFAKLPPALSPIRASYPDKPPPLPPRKSPITPLMKTVNPAQISNWMSNVFPEEEKPPSITGIDSSLSILGKKEQEGVKVEVAVSESESKVLKKVDSTDSLAGEPEKRPTISQRNFSFVALVGSSNNLEAIAVNESHMDQLVHQKSGNSLAISEGTPKQSRKVASSTISSEERADDFFSAEDLTKDPQEVSQEPMSETNQPHGNEKAL